MGMYLMSEVIRRTRENRGISQQELCDGICSLQTLNRIEAGHQTPSRNNFKALMERMGKNGDRYQLCLHGDMETLIEWEKFNLLLANREFEVLDEELQKIEKGIDVEDVVNRQFLLRIRAIADYKMGRIDVLQERELLEKALKLTVPEYRDCQLPIGIYSRNEIFIFCNIASTYNESNDIDTAIMMLEQLKKYFQNTSIDLDERSITEVFAMQNLARYYGIKGDAEKAYQIEKDLMKMCLLTGKGGLLTNILYNLAFEEEVLEKDTIRSQMHFMQAYYIAEIFNNKKMMSHIKNHIKETSKI